MELNAPDTHAALEMIERALASESIPPRIARSCERLAERLRRPVRVGLLGYEPDQRARLFTSLVGDGLMPAGGDWPTIEVSFSARPRTCVTLSDATRLVVQGLPEDDLLERDPAFVQIEAPFDILRRISLLYLAVGEDPAQQAPALAWAARRLDVAIWCTRRFSSAEAAIWAAAPEGLKNHAHLLVFGAEAEAAALRSRRPADFAHVVAVPCPELSDAVSGVAAVPDPRGLIARLEADIAEAQREDIDSAKLLLHRFGLVPEAGGADAAGTGPDRQEAADAADRNAAAAAPVATRPEASEEDGRRALLSEPVLYLKRRARNLFETLDWQDDGEGDWPAEVLQHCCDTADGLRDRAATWPEDDAEILYLRDFVNEASDMAVLLQVEGGAEQAQDAAALLVQLRSEFESKLPVGLPMAC